MRLIVLMFPTGVFAAASGPLEEPSRLVLDDVPAEWTRAGDGRTFLPPDGGAAVMLTPSTLFTGDAEQWAAEVWQGLIQAGRLLSGPNVAQRGAFLTHTGLLERPDGTRSWVRLHTVLLNGRGEGAILIASDEARFDAYGATLAQIMRPPGSAQTASAADGAIAGGSARPNPTMHDYEFVPPENWQVIQHPDHLLLTQSPDQAGCVIQMLPPQPSSGDLEQDAAAMFEMMYPNWGYARSGDLQYTLTRGHLSSGLEYCMKEAQRNATSGDGRYQLEDGAALVVKLGAQVALIAVRHRSVLAHSDCLNRYETWRRFFNSFGLKNTPPPPVESASAAERIVGVWSQSGGGALGEYVFAANGHYAFVGGLGSASTSRDDRYEYLHIRSHAWSGDGTYALAGGELTLRGRENDQPQPMRLRFEQVNHGGTGWKDRLWLLKTDTHGLSEVCYEKKNR